MKFSVLALDYDGTIARNDVLEPSVRNAVAALRAQGIVVILVTGRILDDLRRVAGDLHFVDAVVAENGAVVEFPDTGYSRIIGEPPAPELLERLRKEGISFDLGQVVVEAAADDSGRILDVVRRLELPLALLFNRGRVMVLPQAISKPDVQIFEIALERLHAATEAAVFVGNSMADDVEGARRVGLRALYLDDRATGLEPLNRDVLRVRPSLSTLSDALQRFGWQGSSRS